MYLRTMMSVFAAAAIAMTACAAAPVTPTQPAATTPVATTAPATTATTPPTVTNNATAKPSASATAASATDAPLTSEPTATIALRKVLGAPGALTYMTHAGDQQVMYLVIKSGLVLVVVNDTLRAEPFLDISDRVNSRGSEQGLLSIAISPSTAPERYVYVYYTGADGGVVISRYPMDTAANTADQGSEQILLTIAQPFPNHNGGQLKFGPDGMLYIGVGDGGSGGDPQNHGQNPSTLLGNLLRIDVSSSASPYAIPEDNPTISPNARPEIWAWGLRNPWRFSFDRQTGDLYIADVGQNKFEEINFVPATSAGGENYGWNLYEGFEPFKGGDTAGLTMPIYQYGRALGCSVTGGYVYRGTQIAGLQGAYLYSDYCTGTIWALWRDASGAWQNNTLLESGLNVSSFGEDANGELYVMDLNGGLYRIEAGE